MRNIHDLASIGTVSRARKEECIDASKTDKSEIVCRFLRFMFVVVCRALSLSADSLNAAVVVVVVVVVVVEAMGGGSEGVDGARDGGEDGDSGGDGGGDGGTSGGGVLSGNGSGQLHVVVVYFGKFSINFL